MQPTEPCGCFHRTLSNVVPVEACKQLRWESSSFQRPEKEEQLLGLLHSVGGALSPGEVTGDPSVWDLYALFSASHRLGLVHSSCPTCYPFGVADVQDKVKLLTPMCQISDLFSVVSSTLKPCFLCGKQNSRIKPPEHTKTDFLTR